jgi:hypothetical protein
VRRHADWSVRLAAVIEEWRWRPFAYGSADCLQFANAVVFAITGEDHAEHFPQYRGRVGAARLLCEFSGVEGLITALLGAAKPPAYAQEGDVVMGDFGEGMTAGVCLGLNSAAPGAAGLVFVPTLSAAKAWSI